MKQLLIMLAILMLCTSVFSLGELINLGLVKGETKIIELDVKEGVQLDIMNERHIINVDKITEKGADLDLFLFVDTEQKINYVSVTNKMISKLDFDKDGRGEIYISLEFSILPARFAHPIPASWSGPSSISLSVSL